MLSEAKSTDELALLDLVVFCSMAFVPPKKFKCGHKGCNLSFSRGSEVENHRRTYAGESFVVPSPQSADSAKARSETSQPANNVFQHEILSSNQAMQAHGAGLPMSTTSDNMQLYDVPTGGSGDDAGSLSIFTGNVNEDFEYLQHWALESIPLTFPNNSLGVGIEEMHCYTTDVFVTPPVPGDMGTAAPELDLLEAWPPIEAAPVHLPDSTRTDGVGEDTILSPKLSPSGGSLPSNHRPLNHVCRYEGCIRSFKRKPDLKRHMLTHTGEKPFQKKRIKTNARRAAEVLSGTCWCTFRYKHVEPGITFRSECSWTVT